MTMISTEKMNPDARLQDACCCLLKEGRSVVWSLWCSKTERKSSNDVSFWQSTQIYSMSFQKLASFKSAHVRKDGISCLHMLSLLLIWNRPNQILGCRGLHLQEQEIMHETQEPCPESGAVAYVLRVQEISTTCNHFGTIHDGLCIGLQEARLWKYLTRTRTPSQKS